MSDITQRWYVVQTHPNAEARAVTHLQRQGFATYLPVYRKRRRHARRVDMVSAPLFPRYLFVAVDLSAQRWRSIHSTIGVARLVTNGADPVPVADAIITELRSQEDGGFVSLPAVPKFSSGDAVRIVDGAFTSCLGLFEGMRDDERVAVLLDLLGRKVRVVLDVDLVESA